VADFLLAVSIPSVLLGLFMLLLGRSLRRQARLGPAWKPPVMPRWLKRSMQAGAVVLTLAELAALSAQVVLEHRYLGPALNSLWLACSIVYLVRWVRHTAGSAATGSRDGAVRNTRARAEGSHQFHRPSSPT
jgi:hypothetical protein